MVACGGYNSAVITVNNQLFMFGFNKSGQIGINETSN